MRRSNRRVRAAEEVVALVLSVATLRAAPWMPFSSLAERGLAKIEAALPAARVRELRRLLRRVLVGEPASSAEPPAAIDPGLLATFERTFTHRNVLAFDYVDRGGRPSARVVEPQALLVRAPFWYIIGWDRARNALRLFRMDRISAPRALIEESFAARPLDFVVGVCPDAKR